MDKQRDQAEKALRRLSDDAVRKLANWCGEWYITAGHRRLGRLLLTRNDSSQPEATLSPAINNRHLIPSKEDGENVRVIYGGSYYTLAEATIDSPAFGLLKATLEPNKGQCSTNTDEAGDETAVVFTLLKAWAEVERQQPDGIRRPIAMMAREDWGRAFRDIFHSRRP